MFPRLSTIARRTIGTAFATALLAGSLAGSVSAASPAGDVLDAQLSFRDETSTAVLAVYPFGDGHQTQIGYFRVKGPSVSAMASYPEAGQGVRWKVVVMVASSKSGPYKMDSRTAWKVMAADKVGSPETFKIRNVDFKQRSKQVYVRIVSKLQWLDETGGVLGSAKHTYTDYGLAESTGLNPSFGMESVTKHGAAPNLFTF